MTTYNLGCGDLKKRDCVNVDMSSKCNPDVIADIREVPWTWAETADRIEANNIFEHVEPYTLIKVINECNRVLRVGGRLWIRVPFIKMAEKNIKAVFTDPTHVNYFTLGTFGYYTKHHVRHNTFGKDYGIIPWKCIRNEEWENNSIFLIVELEKI